MSKERYELRIYAGCESYSITDTKEKQLLPIKNAVNILNKQDQQIDQLKQQLVEKDKMHLLDEKEFQHYCAYKRIEPEIKGCLDREREYKQQLTEKQKTIDEINKEFVQAVHDWKTLCAEKDKEIEEKMMSFEKRCQEYYKSDEFKRDFAIQELEKVKNFVDGRTYCANYIKKRIKELKGEKDVED